MTKSGIAHVSRLIGSKRYIYHMADGGHLGFQAASASSRLF